jgi:hypothetical protein
MVVCITDSNRISPLGGALTEVTGSIGDHESPHQFALCYQHTGGDPLRGLLCKSIRMVSYHFGIEVVVQNHSDLLNIYSYSE